MFIRVAARNAAGVLLFLLTACGSPIVALAQMQGIPVATAPAPMPHQAAAAPQPFGLYAVPVTGGDVVTKWRGVEAAIDAESEVLTRCRDDIQSCPAAAQKLLAVIADGRARSGRARIGVVNRAINMAIQPVSDLAQWGVPDRWSPPLETLTTGRGDCEDYAIAKYVALRAAGVAEDDVRLVIVRDLAVGEDHAVLLARLEGSWIALDNRHLILVEDTDMQQIVPLFVLDQGGVKRFAPTTVADAHTAPAPADDPAPLPGSLGVF